MTKIHIHIETEDMDLAERLGRALNGNMTGAIETQATPATEQTEGPKSPVAETVTTPATTTDSGSNAPAAQEGSGQTSPSVELDKAGLPWDERIHSGSKALKADGYWKAKRGVDPELVKQVEAELRAVMALPAGDAAEQPAPTPEQGGYVPPPSPQPEAQQAEAMPEQAAAAPAPQTFMDVVGLVGQRGIQQPQLMEACKAVGLPDFGSLAHRPDLVPKFVEALGA